MSEDEENEQRRGTQQSYKDRRKQQNPERRRHGARNQDKSKLFVRWLVEAFPNQFRSSREINNDDGSTLILDVAGGKGELAARLCVCHQRHVILIDPRPCKIESVFESFVLRLLPKLYQQRFEERKKTDPDFVAEMFRTRFHQLAVRFDADTIASSLEMQAAIRRCGLLVGLHADGATEAIVDAALLYKKPFCVVPCCVFPTLFPQRLILAEDGSTELPVRTYEQFCTYLLRKDPRFRQATLPFEGRNICIWWDGT